MELAIIVGIEGIVAPPSSQTPGVTYCRNNMQRHKPAELFELEEIVLPRRSGHGERSNKRDRRRKRGGGRSTGGGAAAAAVDDDDVVGLAKARQAFALLPRRPGTTTSKSDGATPGTNAPVPPPSQRRRISASVTSKRAAKVRSLAKSLAPAIDVDRFLDASDELSRKVWPAVKTQVRTIVAEKALDLVSRRGDQSVTQRVEGKLTDASSV